MRRSTLFGLMLGLAFLSSGPASGEPIAGRSSDLWTRSTLTGDWNGLRTRLEDAGITFSLNYTTELLTNLQGGIKRGSVGNGLFQPQMDVDLEKLLGWDGSKFRASGVITHGPGFSADYLGNILAASSIEAGPIARLFELWYEKSSLKDRVSVRAGLMVADTEFLTSETASTFTNNSIGWLAWMAGALPAGGPAYPIPALGTRLRLKPSNDTYFQIAAFAGDPSGRDGTNPSPDPLPRGTVLSIRGGAFLISEVGYTPNQGDNASGLPGAYKVGAWYHTGSRFADPRFDNIGLSLADPASTGESLFHSGNWGVYGVIDQTFFRVPGTEDQGLSGFVRVGGSPSDRNLIDLYADGGFVYTGLVPGRPKDKIGIATAYAHISDRARGLDQDARIFTDPSYPVRTAELMVELTYQAKLAPWWTMQADLQHIIRPGAGVANDDGSLRRNAWVLGLRSAVSF